MVVLDVAVTLFVVVEDIGCFETAEGDEDADNGTAFVPAW